jgi:hypothetical protein
MMEHDQEMASRERVRALAESVGVDIDEKDIPALAEAFDAARLGIARLEPLAATIDIPVDASYDAAWDWKGEGR